MGVLAYMRRNGLERPQNRHNAEESIREFRARTANHPIRDTVAQVRAKEEEALRAK